MNVFEIIANHNPFVITGIVLTGLWAGGYVLSWLIQLAWSYVDEKKVGGSNWLASRCSVAVGKGPYPYDDGWYRVLDYYNYHQYENGYLVDECDTQPAQCHEAPPGYKMLGTSRKITEIITNSRYGMLLPAIWAGVIFLNFFAVTAWFALAYGIAVTARMTRRGQKTLVKHINDVKAHQPKDVATSSETSGY